MGTAEAAARTLVGEWSSALRGGIGTCARAAAPGSARASLAAACSQDADGLLSPGRRPDAQWKAASCSAHRRARAGGDGRAGAQSACGTAQCGARAAGAGSARCTPRPLPRLCGSSREGRSARRGVRIVALRLGLRN